MNKKRIAYVRKYSLISLVSDLGYTPIKESARYYTLKEHDSFKIKVDTNTFCWYSRGICGDSITLCQTLGLETDPEFHSFVYTILYLEKRMYENPMQKIIATPIPKKELVLPLKHINNKKAYYYLHERGIDTNIIDYFIWHDYLYQSAHKNNLVFVSYQDKKPVFVSEKGTLKEIRFIREYAGNNYDHCFYIDHHSHTLVVTEAIIDMMSLMSLDKDYKNYNYLSLNSIAHYKSIFYHLDHDHHIHRVLLRLDNDQAGKRTVEHVSQILKAQYPNILIDIAYPYRHKDWNDYLVYGIHHRKEDIIIF